MPPDPPPLPPASPSATLRYAARTNMMETAHVFELTEDVLRIRAQPEDQTAAAAQTIPLRDITHLRLRYFPTRVQTNRYECILTTRPGATLKLTNEFYKSVMSFDDHSADFRSFVTALVRHLARANPQAHFCRGAAAASYYLSLAFFVVVTAILVVALVAFGPVLHWIAFVKLALIICFVPVVFRWSRKNRPGVFAPNAIPPDILPG